MARTTAGGSSSQESACLDELLVPHPPAFALLHRSASPAGPRRVEILLGDIGTADRLADIPLESASRTPLSPGESRHDVLALVPYRQIRERGFEHRDDGEPIVTMTVRRQGSVTVTELMDRIADLPTLLRDTGFDIDDDTYAGIVRRVLADEIGRGEGSNFVVKRSFVATIQDYSARTALAIFRRLLVAEAGAYWTFVLHTGSRTFVGATPERHVSLDAGNVVMNPISGTYRYPPQGARISELLDFLADRKEREELYMVVDEELKMMARVCDRGGRVIGPFLREMARLAHTEYLIEGTSSLDVRTVLRETMFAPTVTGSPLENAFRVIARHEPVGRGYYSGVLALIGRDGTGRRTLDSAIVIRTADIDHVGRLRIGVGATLVRLSDPDSEVAETRAKVAGLLSAFGIEGSSRRGPAGAPAARAGERPSYAADARVAASLRRRNETLARYWLADEHARDRADPRLADRRVLVVDAEDAFTAMLGQQLRSLGLLVSVRPFYYQMADLTNFDFVVVGPGPGDPRDRDDRKIGALRDVTRRLLVEESPFLAVCLGHQVLSAVLGLELVRREVPNQGVQREIDLFGRREVVGFYNTFAARCDSEEFHSALVDGVIQVSRDRDTGQVHALRGRRFASVQFHSESLLTQHGVDILRDLLVPLTWEAEVEARGPEPALSLP